MVLNKCVYNRSLKFWLSQHSLDHMIKIWVLRNQLALMMDAVTHVIAICDLLWQLPTCKVNGETSREAPKLCPPPSTSHCQLISYLCTFPPPAAATPGHMMPHRSPVHLSHQDHCHNRAEIYSQIPALMSLSISTGHEFIRIKLRLFITFLYSLYLN